MVALGATQRYGSRENERVAGAWRQIDHELSVIKTLGFAGYFLTVWDITEFCRTNDIYCQGRGSAANSAVCYSLGITNADAVSLNLFFERFLSPARDGPPDIDVDIESGRREEVIQYVYERYDRHHAAQVAAVITYRSKSALRDVARALGHSEEEANYIRDHVDRSTMTPGDSGVSPLVTTMAAQLLDRPRHLGIHSAGMVLCDRPVLEVCPVEWGRMPGRSVLQWDKDDCAAIGLVKFDLLGLGMLEALHRAVDTVKEFHGVSLDLAMLPQDDTVYDLLCEADTVGVFQVESRAQMATLPRVQPRCFYDLVIEVALIRPGPIQGRAVNPYIRRRRGDEPITYLHPRLEPILRAHARRAALPRAAHGDGRRRGGLLAGGVRRVAPGHGLQALGAAHDEAEEPLLRRHGGERHHRSRGRSALRRAGGLCQLRLSRVALGLFRSPRVLLGLDQGEVPRGLSRLVTERPAHGLLVDPEPRRPTRKRHGVTVLRPDVNFSRAGASLEGSPEHAHVRLGLGDVRSIGEDVAERIVAGAPWSDSADLARRAGLQQQHLEALAATGALDSFGASSASAHLVGGRRGAGPGRSTAGRGDRSGGSRHFPRPVSSSESPTTCGRWGSRPRRRPWSWCARRSTSAG